MLAARAGAIDRRMNRGDGPGRRRGAHSSRGEASPHRTAGGLRKAVDTGRDDAYRSRRRGRMRGRRSRCRTAGGRTGPNRTETPAGGTGPNQPEAWSDSDRPLAAAQVPTPIPMAPRPAAHDEDQDGSLSPPGLYRVCWSAL